MPTPFEVVEAQAMQLTAHERADLADRLWMSVHSREEVDAAWDAEVARRLADIDVGLTECIPADEVFAELRALIESHPPKA